MMPSPMNPMVSMPTLPLNRALLGLPQPAETLGRAGRRPVFGADPAVIAETVEMAEQERIVDLARARLVPAGIVGHLQAGDAAEVGLDRTGEIPLHDLHVVDVVLQIEVARPDALEQPQRLARAGEEEARNVAGIDRLGEQPDA